MSEISRFCAVALLAITPRPLYSGLVESTRCSSSSLQPRIVVSGVRSSCDSVARNSSFSRAMFSAALRAARSDCSSSSRASSISRRSVTSGLLPARPMKRPIREKRGRAFISSQRHCPSARRARTRACIERCAFSASCSSYSNTDASSGCTRPRQTSSGTRFSSPPKNSLKALLTKRAWPRSSSTHTGIGKPSASALKRASLSPSSTSICLRAVTSKNSTPTRSSPGRPIRTASTANERPRARASISNCAGRPVRATSP
ncbi:hypothetical protein D3C81_580930 [compost metagenome]